MQLQTIVIIGLTLAGFGLRLQYLTTSHPFFDEYTTVLAARQILREGWPILPSGLFYEHGLLATYLTVPFTALFVNLPMAEWQPAHWGLMLSRWPSLFIGTLTIPLIYRVGRQGFGPQPFVPLLAAGLFAFSPEGMVWGGRARMYALATLLVLLTVHWAYRGALYPAPARYRWLAGLALLATLLTQLGGLILVPALLAGMLVVGWFSHREGPRGVRPWFFRRSVLLEAGALAAVVGLAILVKRLGRPVGTAALGDSGSGSILTELIDTITYQAAFYFSWPDTVRFLSRQFGVPHHLWLAVIAVAGTVVGLIYWLRPQRQTRVRPISYFFVFLWLLFGLVLLEMVTLLEPFRRNPRYLVMVLPLFYLIVAKAVFEFRLIPRLVGRVTLPEGADSKMVSFFVTRRRGDVILALLWLALFAVLGFSDLRTALATPEPAYEEAFARINAAWQPGDRLVTMNTPAAGLYLEKVHGFTIQNDAGQFLLNADTMPVDRWLGAPWLGSATDLNAVLNEGGRTWFVIDTIRQPVYFRGDWQAVVSTQMEQVWSHDNVLVYRTRPDREALPTAPETRIEATLNDNIRLLGYTLRPTSAQSPTPGLQLTLFWQPSSDLPLDYTTFVHLRSSDGTTIAQRDGQPLEGLYPTSHWRPGEIVIDPVSVALPTDIPSGRYTIFTGLYRLDTLERLPVANDTSGENAIQLGEVTLR